MAREAGFAFRLPGLSLLQAELIEENAKMDAANSPSLSLDIERMKGDFLKGLRGRGEEGLTPATGRSDAAECAMSILNCLSDSDVRSILSPCGKVSGYEEDASDLALGLALYFGIGCETNAAARVLLGEPFSTLLDIFWNDGYAFSYFLCDDLTLLELGYMCGEWDGKVEELDSWQTAMAWFPFTFPPVTQDTGTLGVPIPGARPSFEEAARRFRAGAEAEVWNDGENYGRARCAFWLGMCHAHGYGVRKDMKEAVRWFKESCRLGGVGYRGSRDTSHNVPNRPQVCLALCNLLGLGVTRNFGDAVNMLFPYFMVCNGHEEWEEYDMERN